MFEKLKFRTKFIILLLLVSLIPTVTVAIISYEISKNALYERIKQDLEIQAEHVMDQIDRFLYERYNDTQLLISDSVLLDPNATSMTKSYILKEYLLNLGLYENIHLLDLDGNIIASSYKSTNYPNVSDESWFIETKKLFANASDIHISKYTNKPTIMFSNVVLDTENQPTGIIVAELMWPVVIEILENAGDHSQKILLNKYNIEIANTEDNKILQKDWSKEAKTGFEDKNFLTTVYKSKGYLVYKGNEWKLVLRVPVDLANAPLTQLFQLIGLALIVTIFIIMALGMIIGSRFVEPIRRLTQGVEQIRQGNLNQKIEVTSNDEIGFLAHSFNKMAISLKQKQAKLKRAFAKEKELKDTKDEIWITASHRLRTPLTGLSWSLEMLKSKKIGTLSNKQKEIVNSLYKNTARLTFLVNVLLDAARMDKNKINLTKEYIYLEDILEKTLKSKQIEIKEKKLKIKAPLLNKRKLKLYVDPKKTQEVFDVVFDNAVRYNKKNGKIKINIKKKKTSVVCSFEDSGIGISKNDTKKIFAKFMRGENANVCNTEGVGLSLYLAKIIVESSKGKIWFESELNKKTIFYIELPLAK